MRNRPSKQNLVSKLAISFGAGIVALFGGCQASFERQVQREIRRLHPRIASKIESDYRDTVRQGILTIRRVTEEQMQEHVEEGGVEYAGLYNPRENKIILSEEGDSITSLRHEIAHALMDDEFVKDLNVTSREIIAYSTFRVSQDDFADFREAVKRHYFLLEAKKQAIQKDLTCAKMYLGRNRLKTLIGHLETNDHIPAPLKEEARTKLKERVNKLEKIMREYVDLVPEEPYLKSLSVDELVEYGASYCHSKDFAEKHQDFIEECRKMHERIRARIKLDHPEIPAEVVDSLGSLDKYGRTLHEAEQTFTEVIEKIGKRQIRDVHYAYHPGEIFARMVDSAYSLYLGEPQLLYFGLEERDLKFLDRIEYQGVKIFAQIADKYRVARQMQEDGMPKDRIKKILMDAVSFTWRGEQHHWPRTEFRIRGRIPRKSDASPQTNIH